MDANGNRRTARNKMRRNVHKRDLRGMGCHRILSHCVHIHKRSNQWYSYHDGIDRHTNSAISQIGGLIALVRKYSQRHRCWGTEIIKTLKGKHLVVKQNQSGRKRRTPDHRENDTQADLPFGGAEIHGCRWIAIQYARKYRRYTQRKKRYSLKAI